MKLKIAGVIIELRSKFKIQQQVVLKNKDDLTLRRFKSFLYKGRACADITIKINITQQLPECPEEKVLFISNHPGDGSENWRLIKNGAGFVCKCGVPLKKQLYYINPAFDRVEGYLSSETGKAFVWKVEEIIYNFLHVLLINYLAKHKKGFFVHSMGIKDRDGRGLLFAGESGAGKSTMARIWDKSSKAAILNDDRVIVRKHKGKFFICGTPWHGDFNDYLGSRIEEARISRLMFIYHASRNSARRVLPKEAFRLLYPSLFPTFWDKKLLGEMVSLGMEFVNAVASFRLGFVKSKSVIGFIRAL